jgi:hypothetical protein
MALTMPYFTALAAIFFIPTRMAICSVIRFKEWTSPWRMGPGPKVSWL